MNYHWTDTVASAFTLSCPVLLQRNDLILFSLLKHLCDSADVREVVMAICVNFNVSEKVLWRLFTVSLLSSDITDDNPKNSHTAVLCLIGCSCSSGGWVGCLLNGRSVVRFPAPFVCMSRCHWARNWTPYCSWWLRHWCIIVCAWVSDGTLYPAVSVWMGKCRLVL